MKKSTRYYLILLLLNFGCTLFQNEDDCSTVVCIGPPTIAFEVLQDNTNVFESDVYSLEDVFLTGEGIEGFELRLAEREFLTDNNETEIKIILFLSNDDWQPQRYAFTLNFSQDFSIPISTEIGLSEGDCCGGIPTLESLQINGVDEENPYEFIPIILD